MFLNVSWVMISRSQVFIASSSTVTTIQGERNRPIPSCGLLWEYAYRLCKLAKHDKITIGNIKNQSNTKNARKKNIWSCVNDLLVLDQQFWKMKNLKSGQTEI